MKKYERPLVELLKLELQDVLSASNDIVSESEENFGDLSGWLN